MRFISIKKPDRVGSGPSEMKREIPRPGWWLPRIATKPFQEMVEREVPRVVGLSALGLEPRAWLHHLQAGLPGAKCSPLLSVSSSLPPEKGTKV